MIKTPSKALAAKTQAFIDYDKIKFKAAAQAFAASFEEMRLQIERLGLDKDVLERANGIDPGKLGPNVVLGPWPFLSPILTEARRQIGLGRFVFLAKPGGAKKGAYKGEEMRDGEAGRWHQTRDPAKFERQLEERPKGNLGLPMGAGNMLICIEADTQEGHDVDGIANLARLEEEIGELPATWTQESPSGSIHRIFQHPGAGIDIPNSVGELAPGVDLRGDRGMILLAPSTRKDGQYRRLNNLPAAPLPKAWLDRVVAKQRARHDGDNPFTKTANREPVDVDELKAAIAVIPADCGYYRWLYVGAALALELGDDGREIWESWSQQSEKSEKVDFDDKWKECRKFTEHTAASIFHFANEADPDWREHFQARRDVAMYSFKQGAGARPNFAPRKKRSGYTVEDFASFLPQRNYTLLLTGKGWSPASVNSQIPARPKLDRNGDFIFAKDDEGKITDQKVTQSASSWLDQHRPIADNLWAPGEPLFVENKLLGEGSWIPAPGKVALNSYRPPIVTPGDAGKAGRWTELVERIYPEHHLHLIRYFAAKVQRAEQKINHALVLGGSPGIGKDSLLEPVRHGVGPWNFVEVAPTDLFGSFNSHVKCVMLRISEAHDLGDQNRYSFYERTKTLIVAPPETTKCNEKHVHPYYVLNVGGTVITTNHLLDGIYLPEDDRRHFVAWSKLMKEDFEANFWRELWAWYADGGIEHVVAYLRELDLNGFDAKAPPEKTRAFWDIVNANRSPEEAELSTVFDQLKRPDAVTLDDVRKAASGVDYDLSEWLRERKNARVIPHRLEKCGYVAVVNDAAKDGYWVVAGRRMPIYSRSELVLGEQLKAAGKLAAVRTKEAAEEVTTAANSPITHLKRR